MWIDRLLVGVMAAILVFFTIDNRTTHYLSQTVGAIGFVYFMVGFGLFADSRIKSLRWVFSLLMLAGIILMVLDFAPKIWIWIFG